ncbi:MAG: gephyrin-like molybdotransferase Glp [Pseudomonadota bacterium]
MSGLLAYDDALALSLKGLAPLAAETISVDAARARALVDDVIADHALPPAAVSAMDGYAVRHADLSDGPWRLTLAGEIPAGGAFEGVLPKGGAARIFTGAPVPDGADLIVIQEDVTRDGDVVAGEGREAAGRHIRARGIDFDAGEAVLKAGRVLSAIDVALAAAANQAVLRVRRQPRVTVFASGDELVEPGGALGPTAIVNSGAYGVAGLAETWGAQGARAAILPDDQSAVEKALGAAFEQSDVIVTIGGASVGDFDLIKPAARSLGAEIFFEKVAIRPGKPCWHGRVQDGPLFVGLPGNPASAFVCAYLFLRPLIDCLLGAGLVASRWMEVTAGAPLAANGPRESFLRGRLETSQGALSAIADERQDSSLITPFAAADVLIRRPAKAPGAAIGDPVTVLRLQD